MHHRPAAGDIERPVLCPVRGVLVLGLLVVSGATCWPKTVAVQFVAARVVGVGGTQGRFPF